MRRLLTIFLATALLVAACGDDDDAGGDGRANAIAFLQRQIAESQTGEAGASEPQFDDEETFCMAEGIIAEFGMARVLEASDQEFEDFMAEATAEERRAVVDVTLDCVDLTEQFTAPMLADGVSEESANCIGEQMMDNETFRDVLAEGLATGSFEPTGDDETALIEAMFPIIFACLSPEELARLGD